MSQSSSRGPTDPIIVDDLPVTVLDEYLIALQRDDYSRCQELIKLHPKLAQYTGCMESLHGLARSEQTLPPVRSDAGPGSSLIGTKFGKYLLEAELGRGGMGVVFRALQTDLQRHVALKMILHGELASTDLVGRFLDEARAAARIHHPHVVQVYEVGEQAGQHFLAMEHVDGTSLDKMLRRQKLSGTSFSPDDAVRFILPLVQAVSYLHQQGIIHRDLKPGNILLQRNKSDPASEPWYTSYTAKISDFGLAKSVGDQAGARTVSGCIIGTPGYMAPEQAAGKKDIGQPADIYSLGAILYELLTGRAPFQARTPLDTLVLVLESEPPRPRSIRPDVPVQLEAIVTKCLEKQHERRYASAQELAADLERFLGGEQVQAEPQSLSRRFWHWARREPALASRAGALLAFAAVVQLNYHISANVELSVHLYILGLLALWILCSVYFQSLLNRQVKVTKVGCAWSAVDILVFTSVILFRGKFTGPLIIGYPTLVAMSGLWFHERIIWFTVIAAEIALLIVLPFWYGWDYIRENPHYPIMSMGIIALLGMVMAYQVHRVRSLSRFYGSRSYG